MISGNEKGATLVELSIAIAIFIVLLIPIFALLFGGRASWFTGSAVMEVHSNSLKAIERISRELRESSASSVTIYSFQEPANNEIHHALCFASARSADSEFNVDITAGLPTNNSYPPDWQSVIVYCFYETGDGQKQLRRYIAYEEDAAGAQQYGFSFTFPFSFAGLTEAEITIEDANGNSLTINRENGEVSAVPGTVTVLANNVNTEDTNDNNILDANEDDGFDQVDSSSFPPDNNDGVLDYGVNFADADAGASPDAGTNMNLTGSKVSIKLFISKEIGVIQGRYLTTTVSSEVEIQNS